MNLITWRKTPVAGQNQNAVAAWRDMDRAIERFWRDPWSFGDELLTTAGGVPVAIDMTESDTAFELRAEIPGVKPEDIEITVHGDVLTIAGEKREEKSEQKQGYHRTERRFGSFHRSVQLPSAVDTDAVEAVHEQGVLVVRLKKAASALPKRVQVKPSAS